MKNYQLVFVVLYVPTLIAYLFSETSGNFRRRAVNKIILATMFFVCSLYSFCLKDSRNYLSKILMIAITFNWIGDILLLWGFLKGGVPFFIANIFYSIFAVLYFRSINVAFFRLYAVLFLIFAGIFLLMCYTKFIDISKMKVFVLYMLSIISHGCLGVVMMLRRIPIYQIMGMGLFLFMVSDYFLAMHYFRDKNNKLVLRINSLTYFSGMMLVALVMGM